MEIGTRPRRGRLLGKNYYDITETDALFDALEQEVQRLQPLEGVAQKNAALSETILDQQETIRSLQKDTARLNEAVAARDSEHARLNEAAAARDSEHARLTEIIAVRDSEYTQLTEAHAALENDLAHLQEEHARLQDAYTALHKQYEALEDDRARLTEERDRLVAAQAELDAKAKQTELAQRSENEALLQQIENFKAELERAEVRTKLLSTNLERRKAELAEYETALASDSIAKANERAQGIVSNAIAESDRIFSEISAQRARVIAATRAAYYNALQFKMALTERFSTMERDLDNAIDVLRILETPTSSGSAPQTVYHLDSLQAEDPQEESAQDADVSEADAAKIPPQDRPDTL